MKKNLILFFVLAIMLAGGYWWEEIYSPQMNTKVLDKTKFFSNLENSQRFKLDQFSMEKKDNQWFISENNHVANFAMVQELTQHLSKIHIQAEIQNKDYSQYFNENKISFAIDDRQYVIGNFSKLTGDFYLLDEINKKLYAVSDFSDYEGIYKTEIDLFHAKYEILCSRILAKSVYYIERNFTAYIPIDQMKKIELWQNKQVMYFDFDENNFEPNVYPRITRLNLRVYWQTLWNEIKIINYVPKKGLEHFKEIWLLKHSDYILRLIQKNGYFLIWDHQHWAYEISADAFKKLQFDPKMFYMKSLVWPIDFSTIDHIDFAMSTDQKKWYEFVVSDVANFKIESKDKFTFSREGMNFLFHALLGLADFKEASDLGGWGPNHLLYKVPGFYVKLWSKHLEIKLVANRIILIDLENKFFWEYQYPSDSIGIKSGTDIFTLLSN